MNRKIFIIFVAALALRLIYVTLAPQIGITRDADCYRIIAGNIAEYHAYLGIDGKPDVFWPPGYPLFISVIYMFFGIDNLAAVRITQAILSALTVFPVYFICARVFDPKVGIIAAIITCIYPGFIGYSGMVLPQLLIAFLITAFVSLIIRPQSNILSDTALGLIAGYSVLIRPEFVLFYLLVLTVMAFIAGIKHLSVKRVLLIFVIMCSVISVWSARNYALFGKFIPVSIHAGDTFWISTWKEEWLEWQEKEPFISLGKDKDPIEASEAYFRAAIDNIKEHPFIYLKMCTKRLYRLWLTGYSNVFSFMREGIKDYFINKQYAVFFVKLAMLVFNVSIVIIGFLGIAKAYRILKDRRDSILLLASPIIFVVLFHFFIYATPRYAIPEMPFMIIFASAFIYYRIFKKC